MRVLLVSKFLHHVGGVETYFSWQARALGDLGHRVAVLGMSPPEGKPRMPFGTEAVIETPERDYHGGGLSAVRSAATSVYSPAVYRTLLRVLRDFKPDLVHFHGTSYQLTPAVARAVATAAVPSIVTAHEYKFVCANQRLWDDSQTSECFACVPTTGFGRSREILKHRCVKGRVGPSVLAALEQPVSERLWLRAGPLVHCPSRYMQDLIVDGGWARDATFYLDLPWERPVSEVSSATAARRKVLFLGRLEPEKGVDVLLRAWRTVQDDLPEFDLQIAGSGSQLERLQKQALDLDLRRVRFTGRYEISDIPVLLGDAAVTVHPSIWQENSPYTVRESLLAAVPAVVSSSGGLPEMVGAETGQVTAAGDPSALASGIRRELALARAGTPALRRAVDARTLDPSDHLTRLLEVYAGRLAAAGAEAD